MASRPRRYQLPRRGSGILLLGAACPDPRASRYSCDHAHHRGLLPRYAGRGPCASISRPTAWYSARPVLIGVMLNGPRTVVRWAAFEWRQCSAGWHHEGWKQSGSTSFDRGRLDLSDASKDQQNKLLDLYDQPRNPCFSVLDTLVFFAINEGATTMHSWPSPVRRR
jgi:hypothetical protein